MRKLLIGLFAVLFLMGSSAGIVAAQDDEATPDDEATTSEDASPDEDSEGSDGETNPADPQIGDTVVYFSENGDALANITINEVERGWDGYGEYSEPESGSEFVFVSVTVENLSERSTFTVDSYDFGLQDAYGFFWSDAYVSVDEDPEPPLLEQTLDLEGEATADFSLVFQVYEDTGLNYLYLTGDGHLITLANLQDI